MFQIREKDGLNIKVRDREKVSLGIVIGIFIDRTYLST